MKQSIFTKIISQTAGTGVKASAVWALLSAASCSTEMGVPAVDIAPRISMEESRARAIIEQAFSNQGIVIAAHDVEKRLVLRGYSGDTIVDTAITISIDGFSDSLAVGYEYLSAAESSILSEFPADSAGRIRIFSTVDSSGSGSLVSEVDAFVESLRAEGIIR